MSAPLDLRCLVCNGKLHEWYCSDLSKWCVACTSPEDNHQFAIYRKRKADARRVARRIAGEP